MAKSPAHRWGQIIGNILEGAINLHLQEFAKSNGLYVDKRGKRTVRGRKQKATWQDVYGNLHDLDFVLERDGSDTKIGTPLAFIESAWRRYTKHSRNKAQEIQGAILPIMDAYKNVAPRKAAILGGVFTGDSILQMERHGFRIAYVDLPKIISAFMTVGIDANYDENTSDEDAQQKVDKWTALSKPDKEKIVSAVAKIIAPEMQELNAELITVIGRQIEIVRVLPLHGSPVDCPSIASAIEFINGYAQNQDKYPVAKYEVQIRYNNGDKIDGQFSDKVEAVTFLNTFQQSVALKLQEMQQKLAQEIEDEEE